MKHLLPGTKDSSRKNVTKPGRLENIGDKIFSNLALFFAIIVVVILLALVIILNIDAIPSIAKFGFSFFTSQAWNPVKETFGALPAVYGTLLSSIIALIIAVPISFGAAIFLVEIAPEWVRGPVSFIIEILASIPSVIIGLWGLFVLVPFIRSPIESWLGAHLGFLPLFQGPPFGVGFLSAGIILAIMIIPIITSLTREAIMAVPANQREAMLSLGATKWETILRAVLPYSRSGLVGAVILGLGRALGETMAVTMVIGNSYKLTDSLFSPGATIASKIASEFNEASSGLHVASLMGLALVLFIITLVVNIIARLILRKMTAGRVTRE